MDELDQIRQKRIEQLQQKQQQEQEQQQELAQKIEQLETLAKAVLTKEAFTRYATLKTAHPETAMQSLVIIAQLAQQQKTKHIDDTQFKALLKKITPQQRQTKIKRI